MLWPGSGVVSSSLIFLGSSFNLARVHSASLVEVHIAASSSNLWHTSIISGLILLTIGLGTLGTPHTISVGLILLSVSLGTLGTPHSSPSPSQLSPSTLAPSPSIPIRAPGVWLMASFLNLYETWDWLTGEWSVPKVQISLGENPSPLFGSPGSPGNLVHPPRPPPALHSPRAPCSGCYLAGLPG